MPGGAMQETTEQITFKRILFPTDFSELSERALSYAISLAGCFEATLYVLHVVDRSVEASGMYVPHMSFEELDKEEESAEAAALKKLVGRSSMHAKSLKIEPILVAGTPEDEILRVAREKQVDLIIIGTAGTGGVGRFVFGSNADNLIRNAHVPVLAIPPGV